MESCDFQIEKELFFCGALQTTMSEENNDDIEVIQSGHATGPRLTDVDWDPDVDTSNNANVCCNVECGRLGTLICCDACPAAYHIWCVGLSEIPVGSWYCPECQRKRANEDRGKKRKSKGGMGAVSGKKKLRR